ncbi:MAG: 23S rRNA (uracil(1939)-C(5))-methyltransferase RlmD [Bacilli bacterium]
MTTLSVFQKYKCNCIGISFQGLGICKVNDIVVFIPNLLTGEECEIEITKVKKQYAFAKVITRYNDSQFREKPTCPVFYDCGGCDLSHMNDELKSEVKYTTVENNLKKQGLYLNITNCLEDSSELGYRNKVILHASKIGDNVILGPYQKGTNKVIWDSCLMLDKNGVALHQELCKSVNLYKIEPYNDRTKQGILKRVVYRKDSNYQYMIVVVATKNSTKLDGLIENLKSNKNVASIVININKGKDILSNNNIVKYGKSKISYNVDNIIYNVSPSSFFQINTKVMIRMYDIIRNFVDFNDIVLDAYCGVGSISLYIASKVKKVVGVEINDSSYCDAIENKKVSQFNNVSFIKGDTAEVIVGLDTRFNTLIVDPPRTGCSKEFISFIKENNFEKFIYMSCDSATLARDLKLLENQYNVENIYIFDMFAHTAHVETVVLMSRVKE